MQIDRKEIEQYVEGWINSHEPDTFEKNEHGQLIYSAGPSRINLQSFFEMLLQDFAETLEAEIKVKP